MHPGTKLIGTLHRPQVALADPICVVRAARALANAMHRPLLTLALHPDAPGTRAFATYEHGHLIVHALPTQQLVRFDVDSLHPLNTQALVNALCTCFGVARVYAVECDLAAAKAHPADEAGALCTFVTPP